MRVNFSFVAAFFVALLVLGTVGCRSNGGPWYNPSSYAFTNPFANAKDDAGRNSLAPSFGGGEATANARPSLDAQPNIGIPPGGYTDGTSLAGRPAAGNTGGSTQPPAAWETQNLMAQQPPPFGGYSVPEPTHYSLSGAYAAHNAGATHMSHQQAVPQGGGLLYQEPVQQAHNTMSHTSHQPTALQQPAGVPAGGIHGGWDQPGHHAPIGGNMPSQHDHFAVPPQPGGFPPAGYEQPMMHQPAPVPHQAPAPHMGAPMGGMGADGMMMPQQQPMQPPFQQPVHSPVW